MSQDMPVTTDGSKQRVDAYAGVQGTTTNFWASPVLVWQGGARLDGLQKGDLYCPGVSGPTFAKNHEDYVEIGEYLTPGIAKVSPTKGRDYKINKSYGTDGANLITHGIKLAEVTIEVMIWTPQQLIELERLWSVVFPGRTKTTTRKTTQAFIGPVNATFTPTGTSVATLQVVATPDAPPPPRVIETKVSTSNVAQSFSVYHPRLNLHKISGLYFLEGSGPSEGPVAGSRVFVMKCVEFMKPGKNDVTHLAKAAVAPLGSTLDVPPTYAPPGQNTKNTDP